MLATAFAQGRDVLFQRPGVRPSHGVDHIYSVGPTLLALGPRCGRPGCDVVFPHPRVTLLAVTLAMVSTTCIVLGLHCYR